MADDQQEVHFTINPKIKVLDIQTFDDMEISEASVKSMLPDGFDAKMNIDIMPVVFNLAVVNQINANGDAMNSMAAIKCVKNFANKPINVEHKRHKIVGHMINATLSEEEFDFSDNKLESFADKTTPFYINALGFIYRKIFPDLAEAIITAADEENEEYKSISTSWELASKQFKIVKGAGRDLDDCEYLDADKYEEYRGYLKKFGGQGVDKEGCIVGRVFHGDVIPLGAGLTMNPAADVEGIYPVVISNEKTKSQKAVANKQKNSQKHKQTVTSNKSNIFNMEDTTNQEIVNQITEAVASVVKKDSEAKSIGQLMHETLKQHGETWQSKVDIEAEARAKTEEALEALKVEKDQIKSELDSLKSDMEAKASAETFNVRMTYFDDKYELSDAENEIIASELKSIDADESAFEAFKGKMEVLFAHKSKEVIAKQQEEAQACIDEAVAKKLAEKSDSSETTEATASTEVEQDKAEAEIETEDAEANIPNSNGEQTLQTSLLERAKASFKVEIS